MPGAKTTVGVALREAELQWNIEGRTKGKTGLRTGKEKCTHIQLTVPENFSCNSKSVFLRGKGSFLWLKAV
jgi:hypothetical protein